MKIILIKKADEVAHCVFSPTPLHMQTIVFFLGDNSNYYCCLQLPRLFRQVTVQFSNSIYVSGFHFNILVSFCTGT